MPFDKQHKYSQKMATSVVWCVSDTKCTSITGSK